MDKRYGLLIIYAVILFLCFVGATSAKTWYVDDDGGADFTGIQDAINNASVGDTILVYSGVYYENVVVDKSVTLKGKGHPVVDAGGEMSAIALCVDGITVEGFTATNSGGFFWQYAAIKVSSNNNTIIGNNVSNNYRDGIYFTHSNNNTIIGNNVSGNNDDGIYLSFSCNNTITGNNASNNNDDGIYLSYTSNNIITGNNVNNNNRGIHLDFSCNNNTITCNNACNNIRGISLSDFSNNNTITGNNASSNHYDGIDLRYNSNNTITGNSASNNYFDGIDLCHTSNNIITGNNASNNNRFGIYLDYSSNNNIISGNTFVNDGLSVYYSHQNTVENNTVNGKPLVYLEDASNYGVEDAGQVILVNCNNITVENLDLSNTSVGIELWRTEDSKVLNNTVSNNNRGIRLYGSGNNIITGNTANNDYWDGISLRYSSNNIITGNNASNNRKGINLDSSSNNKIYLNNFINSTDNVSSPESTNIWNSTEKITYTYNERTYTNYLGNYWDDYEEKYPDAEETDSTGIWDTPYGIAGDKDNYPLMEPFENYSQRHK